MVVITHYQRLLDHVVPDKVHVLAGGRIVRSGGRELALELESPSGYAGLGARAERGGLSGRTPAMPASAGRSPSTIPRLRRRSPPSLPGDGPAVARCAPRPKRAGG